MRILSVAEKQGGQCQTGGWQPKEMARRRYQKGSIRKRGKRNPIWELQYWEDYIKPDGSIGRRQKSQILGSVSEMTRRQARKAADEILRPLNLGKVTPLSNLSFREFVEIYFLPNALPTLKLITQKRYRQTLNKHLLPAFGTSRLCDIGTLDLQRFILRKMESGLGWASFEHFRNLMSKIFATAKKWGYHPGENPAIGVELPEQPVHEKQILTPDQVQKLLLLMREPFRTMALIGFMTGLRVGEILGLRWKDIDFHHKQARIEQNCSRGMLGTLKTKSSRRTLPLPTSVLDVLLQLQSRTTAENDEALVFQTSNQTPYSDTNLLHRELKPAGKKIGAPWLSWHTLRRTHCTLFQEAGGSLRDAQAQLGHSKMSTTLEIYTIPIDERRRQTVEKLEQLVTNGGELSGELVGMEPTATQIQ